MRYLKPECVALGRRGQNNWASDLYACLGTVYSEHLFNRLVMTHKRIEEVLEDDARRATPKIITVGNGQWEIHPNPYFTVHAVYALVSQIKNVDMYLWDVNDNLKKCIWGLPDYNYTQLTVHQTLLLTLAKKTSAHLWSFTPIIPDLSNRQDSYDRHRTALQSTAKNFAELILKLKASRQTFQGIPKP